MKRIFDNIKEKYRQHLRKRLCWAFSEELKELDDAKKELDELHVMLGGRISVSADIHYNTDSWAVISLKGKDRGYIKFINLGRKQIDEIARFLRNYESVNVDASPAHMRLFKEGYWL